MDYSGDPGASRPERGLGRRHQPFWVFIVTFGGRSVLIPPGAMSSGSFPYIEESV